MNGRNSTDCEIISWDDGIPFVLWTRLFIEAQGYLVKDNILKQDNAAAQLLANNGKASSSKRTKHIEIRFFFITDLIRQGKITVEHCPSELLTCDYFSKPLQGKLFTLHRNTIQGITPDIFREYRSAYFAKQRQDSNNHKNKSDTISVALLCHRRSVFDIIF